MAASSPEILSEQTQTRSGRRRAASGGHVDGLTGLRGLAAITVVFVHGSGLTAYPWFGLHAYGPIALFVLSGFLLIQPWSKWIIGAAPKPSLDSFIRRRLWRIFPAYLVVLVVAALLLPLSRPVGADGWFRALTLTNTAAADGLRPGMEHTWSLGTELSWYAIVPVVGVLVATLGRRFWPDKPARPILAALGIAIMVSLGWRYFVMFHITDLGQLITFPLWLPAFLFCFLGGAAVAHLMLVARHGQGTMRSLEWLASKPSLVAGIAIASALIGNSTLGGAWTFTAGTFQEILIRTVACTIIATVLLIGVAAGDERSWLNRLFAMPWLVATGRWSYGLYLWHMPLMLLLAREVRIQPGFAGLLIWIAILLAVSIPLAAATYRFVEKPAIAWSKGVPVHSR
ncbi:hypothetical protein N802_17170 [Knoellia sinensis KCTC 19936]|uniref:Acyltransferase 3 domain-containing protein n=1 Tax=Knoellia sinensis KCTC 19936 TaxID=1385520 RepID=A0A0A0J7C0_9MICO|nr:hypothetical protein N802_17170 [Knoellia sinensis KCTC 19936]